MSISAELSNDATTVLITVAGRFDFSTHHDFVQTYKAYPKGQKQFVVDLAGTDYVDSSALGMLLQLREYNRGQANVVLRNSNETVKDVLAIANFDKLFTID